MRSDSKFVLYQYLTGRSGTDKGYNFRKSSNGTPVYDWMNGKTRACTIADEIPTVEIKAHLRNDGSSDLVLVESRHVSTRYSLEGGQINREKCRPYDYSRYLVLPAEDKSLTSSERAEAALKMLITEDFSMDVLEYQQVSEDETIALDPLTEEGKTLQSGWQQMERGLGMNASLGRQNLSAFLARYWESCWNVACGQDAIPLIVVATSPERNTEKKGMAVIPDGLVFFHRQVLPNLPEAAQQLLCAGFGCLAVQTDAQPGTACRVCYPDAEAIQSNCVYRVYHDQVRDDGVTAVHLRIGEMLLKKEMPSAYRVLSTLENSQVMQEDFDYLYNIVDYEMLLEEIEERDIDEETRKSLLTDSITGFDVLKQTLANEGFRPDEITLVLYDLEHRLAGVLRQYWNLYDSDLFIHWLNDYEQLPERSRGLDELRQKELQKVWYDVLRKPYDTVKWDNNPLITLIRDGLTENRVRLIRELLKTGQQYTEDLGDDHRQTFQDLLVCEQDLQMQNQTEAADELLQFVISHCSDSENLLSATSYLKFLQEVKTLTSQGTENLIKDLRKLLKRHCEIRAVHPLQNTSDALLELDRKDTDWKLAQDCILNLDQIKMTALVPEDEMLVPQWYSEGRQPFSDVLYDRLLDQAISLKNRSRDLDEASLLKLNQVYTECLTLSFLGENQNQCPISRMIQREWPATAKWETKLLEKAENNETTICTPEEAVDRLIELRRKEQKEGGDLWLKRVLYSCPNQAEMLNQYLLRTGEVSNEKGTVEDEMHQDVIALINHLSEDAKTIQVPDLERLCKWYQIRGGYRNDELKCMINRRFLYEFQEREAYQQKITPLAALYTEVFNPPTADPEIEESLLKHFDNLTLDEICNDQDALDAIRYLIKKDNSLIQRFRMQLKELIGKSDHLELRNLPQIIQIGEMTETANMAEELGDILEKTSGEIITNDIMDSLAEYVRGHVNSENKLMEAMQNRCINANAEDFDARFTELLVFLRKSEIQEDKQAKQISRMTEMMLDKIEERELSKGLLGELVSAVGKAINYQNKIKTNLLSFYDRAESVNQYGQMEAFVEPLHITSKDVLMRDHSHWMILLFQKKAEQFCKRLKADEDLQLERILDMVNKNSEEMQELEKLRQGITGMEEAQDVLQDTDRLLSESFSDVIMRDQSLKDTSKLPEVIRHLNVVKGKSDRFAVEQLSREAYQYISGLLKDNDRFVQLLDKPASIQELKQCIEALHADENTALDEELRQDLKLKALRPNAVINPLKVIIDN